MLGDIFQDFIKVGIHISLYHDDKGALDVGWRLFGK